MALNHKGALTLEEVRADHRQRYEEAAHIAQTASLPLVLDLGCGVGYGCLLMARRDLRVIGVDNDWDALRRARKFTDQAPGKIQIGYADFSSVTRIPYALTQPTAALAVAFEVLEHLDDPQVLLRALKTPMLMVSVPNQEASPFGPTSHPDHKRHYIMEELEHTVKQAGWRIVRRGVQKDKRQNVQILWHVDRGVVSQARTLLVLAERI